MRCSASWSLAALRAAWPCSVKMLHIEGGEGESGGTFLQHAAVAQVDLAWNTETRLRQLLHVAGRQEESGGTFLQRAWYSAASKLNNKTRQHLVETEHE